MAGAATKLAKPAIRVRREVMIFCIMPQKKEAPTWAPRLLLFLLCDFQGVVGSINDPSDHVGGRWYVVLGTPERIYLFYEIIVGSHVEVSVKPERCIVHLKSLDDGRTP